MVLQGLRAALRSAAAIFGGNKSDIIYCIDHFWCDPYGVFLRGWVHCHDQKIESLHLVAGPDMVAVETLSERPDVAAAHPDASHALHSGFQAYLACRPGVPLRFRVATQAGVREIAVELPRSEPPPAASVHYLFEQFVAAVNRDQMTVLEIGARKVLASSVGLRQHFPSVGRYIGMDIHPAPQVDLVGDAHQLSSLVGEGTIDGIFSAAVLEHLAMPWLIAAEINRALKPGGLVYHGAPQSWPVHEEPNDFWRFSDEGLKILFGPAFGFEVIGAAMDTPMRMYPDCRDSAHLDLPFFPAFGGAYILSRKVAEIGRQPGDGVDLGALAEHSRQYPRRDIT